MAKKKRKAAKAKVSSKVKAKARPKVKAHKEIRVEPKPIRAANKPRTKNEILSALAESTGTTKKEVGVIMNALGDLIGTDIGKTGPKVVTIPGLMKITVVHKPATKARKGTNPFTGEEMMFKAKPARNVVKIRALKGLKERA